MTAPYLLKIISLLVACIAAVSAVEIDEKTARPVVSDLKVDIYEPECTHYLNGPWSSLTTSAPIERSAHE